MKEAEKVACGVYRIVNPDGMTYIGASRDISLRLYQHKTNAGKTNKNLKASFDKFGINKHRFEILYECDGSDLRDCEVIAIKLYAIKGLLLNTNHRYWATKYRVEVAPNQVNIKNIDKKLKVKLEKIAKKEKRTFANQIYFMLDQAVKIYNKKHKPVKKPIINNEQRDKGTSGANLQIAS